jgi:hypothetical protein
VAALLASLEEWSAAASRPAADAASQTRLRAEAAARRADLQESPLPMDVKKFMGRWSANKRAFFKFVFSSSSSFSNLSLSLSRARSLSHACF